MNEKKLRLIIRNILIEEILNYNNFLLETAGQPGFFQKLKNYTSHLGQSVKNAPKNLKWMKNQVASVIKDPTKAPEKFAGFLARRKKFDWKTGQTVRPDKKSAKEVANLLKDKKTNWQIKNILSGFKNPGGLTSKVIGSLARSDNPDLRKVSRSFGQVIKAGKKGFGSALSALNQQMKNM